jgi:hypothetical protein
MTREELKSLISECVTEKLNESVEVIMDEDAVIEAELESALMLESAAFAAVQTQMSLEEACVLTEDAKKVKQVTGRPDGFSKKAWDSMKTLTPKKEEIAKNIATSDNKEEVHQKALKAVCSRLGSGFQVVGGTIKAVVSGDKGRVAQVASIAAAATALAGSITAIAMKIRKNKKADKNNKNSEEEKKED